MKRYTIDHLTTYTYSAPVAVSAHRAHLAPRHGQGQIRHSFNLHIDPHPADLSPSNDYFNNLTHFFSIQELHTILKIHATSEVSVQSKVLPDPAQTLTYVQTQSLLEDSGTPETARAVEFLYSSTHIPRSAEAHAFAAPYFHPDRPLLEAALALNHAIHSDFTFDPTATDWSTPVARVFKTRRGVCQDFAQLMIACFRAHHLPAAYISGYILTHPPEGQTRLIGADASHAWVALHVPAHGWIGLDPTNNCLADDEHIAVATGRDFHDVSPIRGAITGGSSHSLNIAVTVSPKSTNTPAHSP